MFDLSNLRAKVVKLDLEFNEKTGLNETVPTKLDDPDAFVQLILGNSIVAEVYDLEVLKLLAPKGLNYEEKS